MNQYPDFVCVSPTRPRQTRADRIIDSMKVEANSLRETVRDLECTNANLVKEIKMMLMSADHSNKSKSILSLSNLEVERSIV